MTSAGWRGLGGLTENYADDVQKGGGLWHGALKPGSVGALLPGNLLIHRQ